MGKEAEIYKVQRIFSTQIDIFVSQSWLKVNFRVLEIGKNQNLDNFGSYEKFWFPNLHSQLLLTLKSQNKQKMTDLKMKIKSELYFL